MKTENRLVVARGRGGEIGEGGQSVQTSSYKVNKINTVTRVNALHTVCLKGETEHVLKVLILRKKFVTM